jgi:two-component system, NarL family, nitrate/nitrite response regulator NarL
MITTTATATIMVPTEGTLPPQGPAAQFSPRERQIVAFITAGCSNREIAARMGLRTQTVKNHLCRIYRKLGLPNRVQLAVFAVGHGTGEISS